MEEDCIERFYSISGMSFSGFWDIVSLLSSLQAHLDCIKYQIEGLSRPTCAL